MIEMHQVSFGGEKTTNKHEIPLASLPCLFGTHALVPKSEISRQTHQKELLVSSSAEPKLIWGWGGGDGGL